MANTKGKIIIGTALAGVVGVTAYIIFSGLRKRRILNDIYETLQDVTSAEGQQALYSEDEKIKGSYGFDPNFWRGKSAKKPDPKYLNQMSSTIAREIAKKIYYHIGKWDFSDPKAYVDDDEVGIISEIKKLSSQGQLSMVAFAYANAPLNYGNLADDIVDALTGWTDKDSYIVDLNRYVDSLPL
jgi:hypothetical protein